MTDDFTTSKALGWIDPGRMQKGLRAGADLSRAMEKKPFAVESAFFDKAARSIDQDGCQQGEEVSRSIGLSRPYFVLALLTERTCEVHPR